VFDAADGVFAAELSGVEGAELRRWLLGAEGGRRAGRARGLQARIGELCEGDEEASRLLAAALSAARALPGEGWLRRVSEGAPVGPAEGFLVRARAHVLARAADEESDYDLQAEPTEPGYELLISAETLGAALKRIERPLAELVRRLRARLDAQAGELETAERLRIEASTRGMEQRIQTLAAWRAMLDCLGRETPPAFVDWFGLRREEGREADVGLHRRWVDPTVPFAGEVLAKAHGALVTSATLKDRSPEAPDDWASAEVRTGALHLAAPALRSSQPSPFDYAARTRVFIVTDLGRAEPATLAAACRELFLAAGGGALGLFTAVRRLRAVHAKLAPALEQAGLPLYAQHVDGLDNASLIEMFRAEEDSCLLGTDAMRDGVDVPGRALRLIVFERVPWPRPDILHRARRQAFGGKTYDELLARLRLKQAYGRLIRRADDRGVFVMLDSRTPTRLLTAFPEGVAVARVGLAEAAREIRAFLATGAGR
jgi:ATP-dependent DNA helicase DinG